MCGSGVRTDLVKIFIIVVVVKTQKGLKQATCESCVVVPIYVINLIVIAIVWLHELRIRQIVQLGILDFAALLMSKKLLMGLKSSFTDLGYNVPYLLHLSRVIPEIAR